MDAKDPIAELRAERDKLFGELETITSKVTAEGREALTTEERERFGELTKEIDERDERLDAAAEVESRRKVAGAAAVENGRSGVQIVSEARTYTPDAERLHGISFLRDLANRSSDPEAGDRLIRHRREVPVELRDVGTSAFAGLTVPQYLTDLVAPARRAGRPTADIATKHPLPPNGMTVNLSRITTASATAIQATENTDTQETNLDDTLLTINVRTIAGKQDVSRQAIDRSEGVDSIVVGDLAADYGTKLDAGILNDDGTSGTHLGIRSTSSIVSVTYTDGSPTAAEAYPKLFDLVQQIQGSAFNGADALVMLPRRFWWFASQVGTSFPFISAFSNTTEQGGNVSSMTYGAGPAGIIAGLPVYLDASLPTNLGGGTEDVILGVTRAELHLWEEANAPLLIRTDEALSNQLSVRFVVYGYSAFSAGRYPGAHGTITGTGLAAPVF